MGVAEAVPDLRDDVFYLDDVLVRMEAEPWSGQVILHVDDGAEWLRIGWVVSADSIHPTVHVVPDMEAWASRGGNRARIAACAADYLNVVRQRL